MSAAELLALAESVQALTGPCRNTDRDIFYTLGTIEGDPVHSPCFTASIDDAMTLVPKGWRWLAYHWPRKDEPHSMELITTVPDVKCARGDASTPALALTSATLRARAAMMETNDG